MPDVFTSIMALSLTLILVQWRSLKFWPRVALFVALAGSVVMHLTNLPIALGLLLVGVVLGGRRFYRAPGRYGLVGGALLMAIIAMLGVSVVGFKEWSLAHLNRRLF